MHEASIAAHMLSIAEKAAGDRCGDVCGITVSIGEMAGVMTDSLIFAFNALKKETALKNAVLNIRTQRVILVCGDCDEEYEANGFPYICPRCGSAAFRILHGEEIFIKELEVKT